MTLRSPSAARRRGFTLIEVMLASVLAAFVLAAVYMMMNVTVTQTQVSRDAAEVEDLSRGMFNKIGIDLGGTLAPLPPKSGGNNAASGGGSAASSSTTGTGTGATTATTTTPTTTTPTSDSGSTGATATAPASGAATGTTSTPPDASATDTSTAVSADNACQAGVIGDEKKLIIYSGRVPEALGRYGESGQVRADQRQVIYWLGQGGGLYRRERPWVTSDDVRTAADADESATDAALLAEEVTDVQFEYSDGTTWASTWDGTAPGPDGATPLGPPRAVRVTLSLQIPVSRGDPLTKQVSHVIAIRSAPGTYTPPLLEAPTDGGDNAASSNPGSSGSATGGGTTGANGSGGAGGSASGGATGGASSGSKAGSTPSMPSTGSSSSGSKGSATPSAGSGSKGGGR